MCVVKNRKCRPRKKLTKNETALIVVITFCIAAIIGTIVIEDDGRKSQEMTSQYNICMTEKCVRSAAIILAKIDESVDPCDDFYQFVCGNFQKNIFIPDGKTPVTSFSLARNKVYRQLNSLYSAPPRPDDTNSLKLLKLVYKSCMNSTKIKKNLNFIKKAFKELGGWPVIDANWNEKKFDWKQLLYRLRRSNWRPTFFIAVHIEPDLKNSSKRILTITQPQVSTIDVLSNGLDDTKVQAYYEYMVHMASLFGASELSATVEMNEVLHFEINLRKITVRKTKRTSSSEYNPMTIKQLQKSIRSIPWLQFINNYLSPIDMLTSKDIINVASPTYFEKLEDLLLNTKKRIIANHMFLTIVRDSIAHLPEQFRNAELNYLKVVEGKSRLDPKWEQCVWEANKLQIAASSVYIKKFFNRNNKKKVNEIASDIKSALFHTLPRIKWMDAETKKRALIKAEKMESFLGYPDELLDNQKLEKYYEGLYLNSEDHYFQMKFNLSSFSHSKYVQKLKQPVVKSDWTAQAHSYLVNALYNQRSNTLEVTAAIMQDIFFDSERPQYMNYGSIGEVIGHELIHGFDDNGRQFDEVGNLANWWSSDTLEMFPKKIHCSVRRSDNFPFPEDGFLTLNENLADNGGLKLAYEGYLRWLDRHKEEPMLPGLSYESRQMFWISTAIDRCIKYKAVSNKHSPGYFRIVAPFINSEYFSKDFHCSVGSFMNPVNKCELW